MARSHVRQRHDLPTLRAPPPDLYDYAAPPTRRLGRPLKYDLADWHVVDDWPARVPVTPAEVDVFEAWFGDLFDELFSRS
ncbi:MAG TPA: hypothetical protein VMU93_17070 [Caulobacteraceae bacterium]|nr:hypothetical protein [Caulobacteraceae bacterium]